MIDAELLDSMAELLGLSVGLLEELGVLTILQVAFGLMVTVITGKWLFGMLGGSGGK